MIRAGGRSSDATDIFHAKGKSRPVLSVSGASFVSSYISAKKGGNQHLFLNDTIAIPTNTLLQIQISEGS
jgi:hypothetical protein